MWHAIYNSTSLHPSGGFPRPMALAADPEATSLASARILLVDHDVSRRASSRQWLEIAGAPEPAVADTGDEALDILGAAAQQFDVVAFWPVLTDDASVDFAGVLRRCRSPVKLLAVTRLHAQDMPRAGRMAGVTAIDTTATPRGFVRMARLVHAIGIPVGDIIALKRVPALLEPSWANAIYGAGPGIAFHADLD